MAERRSRGWWRRARGSRRGRRHVRALPAVLITAAVVVPLTAAAARPGIPAPAPAVLASLTPATLEQAYAVNRADAARASRMAAAHGDRHRAASERELADPSRDLLAFDGRGAGRAVEVCHSYGTVVCGRAAPHLDVSDLVLLGSPGTGAQSAAGLGTRARVWAARGADDWVADVPHVSADLFGTTVGLGADPLSPAFGARVFAAGSGGHSDYFRPGSPSLANIARIVVGAVGEVTGG
ncbi:hypothetical protein JHN59_41970 [Streptomyces sp. MBT49]|uniref:alpha/beta hydrolase n=1 Tax=Streptomyces sp. MBT49 TaxID=1488380 RepID=UPI00190B7778|nr:alpha/beta hydrolase [Streptomyces sp. MBT49]MBK3631231.1 hypothetical protein [Streptomyces sp. MBT49]